MHHKREAPDAGLSRLGLARRRRGVQAAAGWETAVDRWDQDPSKAGSREQI